MNTAAFCTAETQPKGAYLPIAIRLSISMQRLAMSSLARSLASLYCQKLRSTTRLGPVTTAPPHFQGFDRPKFLASGGPACTGRRPAVPRQYEEREKTTLFTWARFVIGSVLGAATPFIHSKWASFLRIQNEVEVVKDAVEVVAEVVEEAATMTEKVASEVAEQLPEGGRLRPVAVLVEHASKEVAEEAHLAKDIIHKVDEIEEDMKAIIEPFVDHGKHAQGKAQQRSNHSGK